eukprot:s1289_g13.t2
MPQSFSGSCGLCFYLDVNVRLEAVTAERHFGVFEYVFQAQAVFGLGECHSSPAGSKRMSKDEGEEEAKDSGETKQEEKAGDQPVAEQAPAEEDRLTPVLRMMEGGNFAAATKALLEMLKDDPNDAVVLHNLGVAFTEEGRYQEAEEKFLQAWEAQKNANKVNYATMFGLATVLTEQGETGKLLQAEALFHDFLEKAISQAPIQARACQRHVGSTEVDTSSGHSPFFAATCVRGGIAARLFQAAVIEFWADAGCRADESGKQTHGDERWIGRRFRKGISQAGARAALFRYLGCTNAATCALPHVVTAARAFFVLFNTLLVGVYARLLSRARRRTQTPDDIANMEGKLKKALIKIVVLLLLHATLGLMAPLVTSCLISTVAFPFWWDRKKSMLFKLCSDLFPQEQQCKEEKGIPETYRGFVGLADNLERQKRWTEASQAWTQVLELATPMFGAGHERTVEHQLRLKRAERLARWQRNMRMGIWAVTLIVPVGFGWSWYRNAEQTAFGQAWGMVAASFGFGLNTTHAAQPLTAEL